MRKRDPHDSVNTENNSQLGIDTTRLEDIIRASLESVLDSRARCSLPHESKKEVEPRERGSIEKCEEELNTTLIFAGILSALSSIFIIDAQSKLQPQLSEQSAASFLAFLLSLNQSTISTVPLSQLSLFTENIAVDISMSASLTLSLFIFSIMTLVKQQSGRRWLDMASPYERIGALLLACGIYRYTSLILSFTPCREVLFYLGIVVTCAYSYGYSFQVSKTTAPLDLRKRNNVFSLFSPIGTSFKMVRLSPSVAGRMNQWMRWCVGQLQSLASSVRGDPPLQELTRTRSVTEGDLRSSGTSPRPSSAWEAAAVIDFLEQGLRDDSPLCINERKRFALFLAKMCHQHELLPPSYLIADQLRLTGERPIGTGGNAEVWQGMYRGSQVVTKVLRGRQGVDPADLEKVWLFVYRTTRTYRHEIAFLPGGGNMETAQTPERIVFDRHKEICGDPDDGFWVDGTRHGDGLYQYISGNE